MSSIPNQPQNIILPSDIKNISTQQQNKKITPSNAKAVNLKNIKEVKLLDTKTKIKVDNQNDNIQSLYSKADKTDIEAKKNKAVSPDSYYTQMTSQNTSIVKSTNQNVISNSSFGNSLSKGFKSGQGSGQIKNLKNRITNTQSNQAIKDLYYKNPNNPVNVVKKKEFDIDLSESKICLMNEIKTISLQSQAKKTSPKILIEQGPPSSNSLVGSSLGNKKEKVKSSINMNSNMNMNDSSAFSTINEPNKKSPMLPESTLYNKILNKAKKTNSQNSNSISKATSANDNSKLRNCSSNTSTNIPQNSCQTHYVDLNTSKFDKDHDYNLNTPYSALSNNEKSSHSRKQSHSKNTKNNYIENDINCFISNNNSGEKKKSDPGKPNFLTKHANLDLTTNKKKTRNQAEKLSGNSSLEENNSFQHQFIKNKSVVSLHDEAEKRIKAFSTNKNILNHSSNNILNNSKKSPQILGNKDGKISIIHNVQQNISQHFNISLQPGDPLYKTFMKSTQQNPSKKVNNKEDKDEDYDIPLVEYTNQNSILKDNKAFSPLEEKKPLNLEDKLEEKIITKPLHFYASANTNKKVNHTTEIKNKFPNEPKQISHEFTHTESQNMINTNSNMNFNSTTNFFNNTRPQQNQRDSTKSKSNKKMIVINKNDIFERIKLVNSKHPNLFVQDANSINFKNDALNTKITKGLNQKQILLDDSRKAETNNSISETLLHSIHSLEVSKLGDRNKCSMGPKRSENGSLISEGSIFGRK